MKAFEDPDHPGNTLRPDVRCMGCGCLGCITAWGPWCFDCNVKRMRKIDAALAPLEALFHAKRDPLICPGRDAHEFEGFRMFEDGLGGETVCKHCGIGAMEHSMALDNT